MRKIIAISLVPAVLLASCSSPELVAPKKNVAIESVRSGSIAPESSFLVTVVGKRQSDLAFKASGRIMSVSANVGDRVKKWQELARLGNEEATSTVSGLQGVMSGLDALRTTIGNSDGDLRTVAAATERLYAERLKMVEQDIAKARAATEIAERESDLAESDLKNGSVIFSGSVASSDDRTAQAVAGLDMAKRSLETTNRLYDSQKASFDKNALSALANAFIIARNAREFEDGLLGLTDANRTKNDGFETYLGAKNTGLKPQVEAAFWKFDTEYRSTYDWYYASISGKTDVSSGTIRTGLEKAQKTLESLRDSLHLTATLLENSVPGTEFPESMLTAYKTQNSTFLQNLESVILSPNGGGVQGIREWMQNLESEFAVKFAALEEGVRIAEKNLDLAKNGQSVSQADRSKSITALTIAAELKGKAVNIAKISLDQAEMQQSLVREEMRAKVAEVEASRGEVAAKAVEAMVQKAQVKVQADASKIALESGIIRAPFDGIVTRRSFDPGAVVSGGMPVFGFSDDSELLIKFGVPESISIAPNQAIDVVTGMGTHTGTVLNVAASLDPVTKKRAIEVRLPNGVAHVGEDVRAYVRSGGAVDTSEDSKASPADASMTTAQPAGLIVPRESVVSKYSIPAVFVIESSSGSVSDSRAKLKFVRIIAENDRFLSVEWIDAKDRVVTTGKDSLLDGDGVRITK